MSMASVGRERRERQRAEKLRQQRSGERWRRAKFWSKYFLPAAGILTVAGAAAWLVLRAPGIRVPLDNQGRQAYLLRPTEVEHAFETSCCKAFVLREGCRAVSEIAVRKGVKITGSSGHPAGIAFEGVGEDAQSVILLRNPRETENFKAMLEDMLASFPEDARRIRETARKPAAERRKFLDKLSSDVELKINIDGRGIHDNELAECDIAPCMILSAIEDRIGGVAEQYANHAIHEFTHGAMKKSGKRVIPRAAYNTSASEVFAYASEIAYGSTWDAIAQAIKQFYYNKSQLRLQQLTGNSFEYAERYYKIFYVLTEGLKSGLGITDLLQLPEASENDLRRAARLILENGAQRFFGTKFEELATPEEITGAGEQARKYAENRL